MWNIPNLTACLILHLSCLIVQPLDLGILKSELRPTSRLQVIWNNLVPLLPQVSPSKEPFITILSLCEAVPCALVVIHAPWGGPPLILFHETDLRSLCAPRVKHTLSVLRTISGAPSFLRGGSSILYALRYANIYAVPLYCIHVLEGANSLPRDAVYILTVEWVDFISRGVHIRPTFEVLISSKCLLLLRS